LSLRERRADLSELPTPRRSPIAVTVGPGHYEHTANPGELGNFAIAGHRAGHGAPFGDLDEIEVGDVVEIESATGVWTSSQRMYVSGVLSDGAEV
jgi:sortase (surface protein transpeptidase)